MFTASTGSLGLEILASHDFHVLFLQLRLRVQFPAHERPQAFRVPLSGGVRERRRQQPPRSRAGISL